MIKTNMIRMVRNLVVLAMLVVAATGAFAQGRGGDKGKRPPKEPAKVIENRKENPPPPKNDRPKQDKPKRP
ncbi:MAG: hypothetical protein LC794_06665 [Acidobacteria bacterium]|nr:hypothetical protein [Acidobacteriota bacterium]